MKGRAVKSFAIALAFLGTALFVGCSSDDDESMAALYQLLSSGDQGSQKYITVAESTKTLVLSGVKGKTIYMTRTNPSSQKLAKENTRAIKQKKGFSSNLIETPDFLSEAEEDPHELIYKNFWNGLKNYSLAAKSLAPSAISAARTYSKYDTETFKVADPDQNLQVYIEKTFKLIVLENEYNIWVDESDPNYAANQSAFETEAQKLGKKFINGYGLVSHIYGEPTKHIYIYNPSTDTLIKDEALSTYSKTGEKINILLYEMWEKGKLFGFVDPKDSVKGFANDGRFLYMDSKTLSEMPMEAYSTSLHEFSHAISFNVKTLEQDAAWTYWYGELLAMLCEDMMQAYLGISDSDVNENLGYTPKVRLSAANYTDSWGYGLSGKISPTYSSAFLLGSWLSRKFGGVKFIRELARNNSVDMKSILAAVKTVAGKTYTEASLLQEFAGDMLVPATNAGHNQNAATYSGNKLYTHTYTDDAGQTQTYLYPITAINLWDPFYAWGDASGFSIYNFIANTGTIPFDQLPEKNTFKKLDWSKTAIGSQPAIAYLGPILFNTTAAIFDIGPYGSMLINLGTASEDSVTLEFECFGGGSAGDVITIWIK